MSTGTAEGVTCPWCRFDFEIDLRDAAYLFECPSCTERLSLGSLRHPNFDLNAIEISHGLSTAAVHNLHRYSLAYVYRKDCSPHTASGTLIRIGGRTLIATTTHSVPSRIDWVTVVSKLPTNAISRQVKALSLARHASLDVGIIELEDEAPTLLGMDCLQSERIADIGSGRHAIKAWLIGYPSAMQVPNYPEKGVLGFEGRSVTCEPIAPLAWPRIPVRQREEGKLDAEQHVVIHYSQTEPLYVHEDNPSKNTRAPNPVGMSGGGYWQCRQSAKGRVWTAEELCLFAIQSDWPKFGEHLRGVQIVHWLKLVASTYPELNTQILEQFPRVALA